MICNKMSNDSHWYTSNTALINYTWCTNMNRGMCAFDVGRMRKNNWPQSWWRRENVLMQPNSRRTRCKRLSTTLWPSSTSARLTCRETLISSKQNWLMSREGQIALKFGDLFRMTRLPLCTLPLTLTHSIHSYPVNKSFF